MKLMTAAIKKRVPPINSTGKTPAEKIPVIAKYFFPAGRYTFYMIEGEPTDNGDWLLFGYVKSPFGADCDELGTVMLSDLETTVVRGIRIERDKYFRGHTLKEVMATKEIV